MNTELMNELKELLSLFPRSFINAKLEVILITRTNTYFSLDGVQSLRELLGDGFTVSLGRKNPSL
ncbi:hypothetical protein [Streptococcus orisratti]